MRIGIVVVLLLWEGAPGGEAEKAAVTALSGGPAGGGVLPWLLTLQTGG